MKKPIDILEDIYPNRAWIVNGDIDQVIMRCMEAYTAQFATEAEEGKEHIIPHGKQRCDFTLEDWRDVALEYQDVCKHQSISILRLSEDIAALTAPSNNSSSEILERSKVSFAFTYEQLLTLPWYWGEENGEKFTHNYKPGYDNIDGNPQYFGTSKQGMRIISVNADYVGHTYVEILCDGGTRKGFNGSVRSFEELQLINSLVL